jgi:hypothetical protein
VGISPFLLKSDGADIWVANNGGSSVSRVTLPTYPVSVRSARACSCRSA